MILEHDLIDNNFEDNLIKKLDFQKFKSIIKSRYNARKSVLFKRDFYIYKERILNKRTYEDISKDVNRTRDLVRCIVLKMTRDAKYATKKLRLTNR